ncbi:MAG: hypothetical protein MJY62_04000 [Bacteroidales bacterium]|nr:hypothetical protein [Bacteroidales bacterium]
MMRRTIFLTVASFLSAAAFGQNLPFKPEDAVSISDTANLVAHCSTFAFHGARDMYFAYYQDSEQKKEYSAILSTFPVLAKVDRVTGKVSYRKDVIKAGETIGDFTHGPRAPYDPNVLVLGKTLMVYFNGCVGTEVTYCARPFDLRTETFEDRIVVCKLRYVTPWGELKTVDLSAENTFKFFEDNSIPAKYHNDLCISARFIPYRGEYYSVLCNVFTDESKPVVVKTSDGVNFDVVMICRDFEWGACEASLEIVDDQFYVAMRNSGCPKEERGTFVAKYAADGTCLAGPVRLGRCQSKTALVYVRGKVYVLFNDWPNLNTSWGNVMRSRLRVAEIGPQCETLRSWDITNPYGIHYPYVNFHGRKLYVSFTEDRKMVDVRQCRSNISYTEVKFK